LIYYGEAYDCIPPVVTAPSLSYVMLVSGLLVGPTGPGSTPQALLGMQMLMDFVAGRLGGDADVQLASKIVRYEWESYFTQ
jgi:uncharacterized RDD family membrane protein YckC